MKRTLLFFSLCIFLFACSKKSTPAVPQQTTGVLYYSDPAVDGSGLYFLTDVNQEYLHFYNDSGNLFNSYQAFKDSIGLHLKLSYLDEGRRGCPFSQIANPPQQRIVKLISLVKE